MNYRDRSALADGFERELCEYLNENGHIASRVGQGLFPPELREKLKDFKDSYGRPSLLRWFPDILASNGRSGLIALIDAKTTQMDRDNYSIEMSSLEATEKLVDEFFTPTFFVFDDYKYLAPRDVKQRGTPGPPPSRNGSGTPYVLVCKRFARSLDLIFPTKRLERVGPDAFVPKPFDAEGLGGQCSIN